MQHINPRVAPSRLKDLHPTQITVGMAEVEEKRKRWARMRKKVREEYLASHMVPIVIGLDRQPFLLDHHHEGLALLLEGQKRVLTLPLADLSHLGESEFWVALDLGTWCHPYDHRGRRLAFKDIPKALDKLTDDPYRSLAGAVRRAGGYAKSSQPFSEFRWADFFRRRLTDPMAVDAAIKLARDKHASHLPGWAGPHDG